MLTSELVKINKDYFIKAASMSANAAIFVAFPYLNFPPLNILIEQGIKWLVGRIANGLELLAFFTYIDFRVDAQGAAYVVASREANRLQTEESRKKADEAFKVFAKFNT